MATQSLLEDFMNLDETAEEFGGVSVRTVRRYMSEPDGLPYLIIGGKTKVHRPTAREWLMRRMKRPNPTRGRRAA
jgi:hypothetical protein